MKKFRVKIYADGGDVESLKRLDELGFISGFTTNPTLMKKAGTKDYYAFAKEAAEMFRDKSLSLEVISDDAQGMILEAKKLAELGGNIMVKIPVVNSEGVSSIDIIRTLSEEGVNLNITSVFTEKQAEEILKVLSAQTKNYISVFAGRIADTGRDAKQIVGNIVKMCEGYENVEVLWASCREVYNIIEAENCNCDIITVTSDILNKVHLLDKDLDEFTRETARSFYMDAKESGFRIL